MTKRLLTAMLLALATNVATAQPTGPVSSDLPFTTISKTAYGNQPNPVQVAITNQADYDKFFGGQAPTTPAVDFSTEDVLAVGMGTRNTGGYSIEITRVEHMNYGFTGGWSFVHYVEKSPAPGSIVTMALTQPVHVVKVKKGSINYGFSNDTAVAAAYDTLSLGTQNGSSGYSSNLVLDPSGACTLYQSSPTARYAPLPGQATAAELKAVNDAFAAAKVTTLPKSIPDPRMIIGVTTITLDSTITGTTYSFAASLDYYGSVAARVKPLVDAMLAIGKRLKNPAASFEDVVLTNHGGLVIYSDQITVKKSGVVTIDRQGFRGFPSAFYTGQATAAELTAIQNAFAAADVATLPATIDDPVLIMDIPSVRITSNVGGTTYDTDVTKSGFYGAYDARVRPLVDSIRAVADRIVQANQDQTITALVKRTTTGLNVGTFAVARTNPLFRVLERAVGKQATIDVRGTTLLDVRGRATVNLNIRKGAGFFYSVIDMFKAGEEMKITGVSVSGLWYKVGAHGNTGWSYASYIAIGK